MLHAKKMNGLNTSSKGGLWLGAETMSNLRNRCYLVLLLVVELVEVEVEVAGRGRRHSLAQRIPVGLHRADCILEQCKSSLRFIRYQETIIWISDVV
ncbi:unnamed protein product [Toxocara canis]|uniref:Secreted protein n=1 Tax=Toxocara canis TaxID=6265 RepID=A0A183UWW5_TOXCA|nr:unnamed protein product [Toxocara canis]